MELNPNLQHFENSNRIFGLQVNTIRCGVLNRQFYFGDGGVYNKIHLVYMSALE